MNLRAITIGYAIPNGNFDATVHSVFQSAINLCLNKADNLLTLLATNEADLPQGIRIDAPNDFSYEIFHAGEPVTCRDGNLHLESLTVELRGARCWKCDLPALKADTTKPTVSAAWDFIWNVLNQRQKLSGAEIVAEDLFRSGESEWTSVSRKAGEALRDLVNATGRYELTDPSMVKSLIGLGSGLTPSGDDLLVGYMAGLWCAIRDRRERVQLVSDLGKAIIQHSSQTNDISRTYLYHASRGQVSSLLVNLAEAICMGENFDRILDTAETAMQVGHTSGMEAVTGLLVGLTAWEGNHLFST